MLQEVCIPKGVVPVPVRRQHRFEPQHVTEPVEDPHRMTAAATSVPTAAIAAANISLARRTPSDRRRTTVLGCSMTRTGPAALGRHRDQYVHRTACAAVLGAGEVPQGFDYRGAFGRVDGYAAVRGAPFEVHYLKAKR